MAVAARRVRGTIIKPASKTLMLPSSMELPVLAEGLDESQRFNEEFAIWWDRARSALMFAWESQLIGGIKEDVEKTTSSITDSVKEIETKQKDTSLPGASGGSPSSTGNTWDGGAYNEASHSSRADGGSAGPSIFSLDGGTPESNYSFAVQPEVNEVDHSEIHDLITGTHSGGTP